MVAPAICRPCTEHCGSPASSHLAKPVAKSTDGEWAPALAYEQGQVARWTCIDDALKIGEDRISIVTGLRFRFLCRVNISQPSRTCCLPSNTPSERRTPVHSRRASASRALVPIGRLLAGQLQHHTADPLGSSMQPSEPRSFEILHAEPTVALFCVATNSSCVPIPGLNELRYSDVGLSFVDSRNVCVAWRSHQWMEPRHRIGSLGCKELCAASPLSGVRPALVIAPTPTSPRSAFLRWFRSGAAPPPTRHRCRCRIGARRR